MRQIKHEKECVSRISKQEEIGWENKARLICVFTQLGIPGYSLDGFK